MLFALRRSARNLRHRRAASNVFAELMAAGTDPDRRKDAHDTLWLCERAARLLRGQHQDATLAAVTCLRSGRLLLADTRENQLAAARKVAKRGLREVLGYRLAATGSPHTRPDGRVVEITVPARDA